MKTIIYANYGMIAHEKETVYSTAPAQINDAIEVDIPEAYETQDGIIAVDLGGSRYMLSEVLSNSNARGLAAAGTDKPILRWYDGQRYRARDITILEYHNV